MDELDRYIANIVSKKISEPPQYEETIKNALNNTQNQKKLREAFSRIAVVMFAISTIGGIAYAVQQYQKNNTNLNETRIENKEYIQKLNMEYQTKENLSIKLDSISADDFNIRLKIDYQYVEPITSAESEIEITDEKGNLIYYNSKLEVDEASIMKKKTREDFVDNIEFIKQGSVPVAQGKNAEQYNLSQMYAKKCTSEYQNIDENHIKRTIYLSIDDLDDLKFPEFDKLYVKFMDVTLQNEKKKIKEIKESFNFELKLNKKYISRESHSFKQANIQKKNQHFEIIKAEATNTQLLLKIKCKNGENVENLTLDSIQIFDEKENKYINASDISSKGKIINVMYDINNNTFSNIVKVRVMSDEEIILEKES